MRKNRRQRVVASLLWVVIAEEFLNLITKETADDPSRKKQGIKKGKKENVAPVPAVKEETGPPVKGNVVAGYARDSWVDPPQKFLLQ